MSRLRRSLAARVLARPPEGSEEETYKKAWDTFIRDYALLMVSVFVIVAILKYLGF